MIIDGALPLAAVMRCRAEMRQLHEQGRLRPALVGRQRQHAPALRGDWICWLESATEAPGLQELWSWWDGLREEIRQSARLPLMRFAVQLARYPGDGTQYVRHKDAMPGDPNRRVTAVLYLNHRWRPEAGGALRIWEPAGIRDIEPVAGRLVLFLSEALPHAVLPTHDSRVAVTAWFRGAEPLPMLPDAAR